MGLDVAGSPADARFAVTNGRGNAALLGPTADRSLAHLQKLGHILHRQQKIERGRIFICLHRIYPFAISNVFGWGKKSSLFILILLNKFTLINNKSRNHGRLRSCDQDWPEMAGEKGRGFLSGRPNRQEPTPFAEAPSVPPNSPK